MTQVFILGGGVAGLAAAYRTTQLQPDWQVAVLEADDHLGGLAAGWRNKSFSADLGPHRIYTELPEIEALLPELISRDQMITVQRRSELLLEGHFYQYPVRALELLKRMGFARMTAMGLSAVKGKAAGVLKKPANYEQAMQANFGDAVYQKIIAPYTRKVWKINPRELSEEVARVRVSAGNANRLVRQLFTKKEARKGAQTALSSFSYIKGGVEGLVKSLEAKVSEGGAAIAVQCGVSGFEWNGSEITALNIAGSKNPVLSFDPGVPSMVLSTLPITDLVAMLQPLSPDLAAAEAASGLVYVGLILVALVVDRPQVTPNSWIYFPEEQFVFNRAYEPKNFDPGMAPPGQAMMVFEVTARWDSDLWQRSDADLIEAVKTDAIRSGLLTEKDISEAFAVRVPHTYPLYTVDYRERLDVIFAYLGRFKNLVTTGRQGLFNHNNMDHSMLMGMRAAECLAQGENPAARWYNSLDQFSHFRIVD